MTGQQTIGFLEKEIEYSSTWTQIKDNLLGKYDHYLRRDADDVDQELPVFAIFKDVFSLF